MKINLRENQEEFFKTDNKLWRESPCTLQYVCPNIPIDRTQRFNIGSIYYKDEVNKQKKIFTQFQKPELLLQNFRRQIEEASHNSLSKRKFKSKSHSQNKRNSNEKKRLNINQYSQKLRLLNQDLVNGHIYNVPPKLQLKHDKFGNRSNYFGQYDVKDIMQRFRSTKKNFTSSQRMDLALPLNFYPGPGSYFTQNKSQKEISKRNQVHKSLTVSNIKMNSARLDQNKFKNQSRRLQRSQNQEA